MDSTATPPVKSSSIGIRYGVLTGLVMVIISFGLSAAELDQTPAKWLTTVLLIVGIVLALRFFKQQNRGFMSFGQGLSVGTLLSIVAGVINAVYSYIYINFVDPAFADRILEKTRSDMEARGGLSDAQMEQALAWTAKFLNGPLMMASVIFMILLVGFLASLVISAITKNARPEFE